ncbi:hypothetical protein ACHAWF_004624 [Thalassiosira exigua]
MSSNDMLNDDPAYLRRQLAELSSELLRLQGQTDAEPRRTGAFSPECLRHWVETICCGTITPAGHATSPLSTSLSKSDGNLPSEYEILQIKKVEAEAAAALLNDELVSLRAKHEDERRKLTDTAKDLRRRNDELERRVTLQLHHFDSKASGTEPANGRSSSCSRAAEGDDHDGAPRFGSRMRALAQRWASPHPRGSQYSASEEEDIQPMRRPSDCDEGGSCSSTIITNEDFGQVEFNDDDTKQLGGESTKTITALEEKFRQSEKRATILQQRLKIVKESGDAVIQSLNEELSELSDDRARSEAAMVKELSNLDSQRRAEREDYEARIQKWIAHDADRKLEVEEYERRIESLLSTVRMMSTDLADVGAEASSWDKEAEEAMYKDLVGYIELLKGKVTKDGGTNRRGSLVASINQALDLEFNANPNVADDMIEYYRKRPELKEFTLKSELPRMDYEILVVNGGKDTKLTAVDEIRSYFAALSENDEEMEIILRAANQSLLADPIAMMTGEGLGKLVHSGSFHSTVIATMCTFKLDLRREGERRIKVLCELAVCVPSGVDTLATETSDADDKEDKAGATLELARANLIIQFSPSPTSTPSGPLVTYHLMDIKPTITDYKEGSDNAKAVHDAAAALARDQNSHIQCGEGNVKSESLSPQNAMKNRFFSTVKSFSSNRDRTMSE